MQHPAANRKRDRSDDDGEDEFVLLAEKHLVMHLTTYPAGTDRQKLIRQLCDIEANILDFAEAGRRSAQDVFLEANAALVRRGIVTESANGKLCLVAAPSSSVSALPPSPFLAQLLEPESKESLQRRMVKMVIKRNTANQDVTEKNIVNAFAAQLHVGGSKKRVELALNELLLSGVLHREKATNKSPLHYVPSSSFLSSSSTQPTTQNGPRKEEEAEENCSRGDNANNNKLLSARNDDLDDDDDDVHPPPPRQEQQTASSTAVLFHNSNKPPPHACAATAEAAITPTSSIDSAYMDLARRRLLALLTKGGTYHCSTGVGRLKLLQHLANVENSVLEFAEASQPASSIFFAAHMALLKEGIIAEDNMGLVTLIAHPDSVDLGPPETIEQLQKRMVQMVRRSNSLKNRTVTEKAVRHAFVAQIQVGALLESGHLLKTVDRALKRLIEDGTLYRKEPKGPLYVAEAKTS